ncbi:hypothetical protein LOTGIDRAFT_232483 [Lottia gigantea]|uniref:DUF4200 domain-containing protein n=1 Tax=Lottia gigantea TaxID=225164 RepID=V4AGE4_LOTGI|nr:hypothetical protein LOTGIDRAFT_232483 [Lottia gigantea]ESO94240.1 hypothetical protein LOTGIDRAFT_232483 [Lottia gigantea]
MAATKNYKLDLDPPKRNVFVTQLHAREDEDDIVQIPVVKEKGHRLLESSSNTHQRTLLLKQEVEIDKVDAELEAKRREFKERMEACEKRRIEVQKKQQRMKDRVAKFEKFIEENEIKQRRAIQKYQQEVRLRDRKKSELEELQEQLEKVKQRHRYLQKLLTQYKKYETYLLAVVEAMPEDYITSSEDKVKGLMMRHRTLYEANKDIVDKLGHMEDEYELKKTKLENIRQDHNKRKVSFNSELAHLKTSEENKTTLNQRKEQEFLLSKGALRKKRTNLGVIYMSIDNIYEKCRKILDLPADKVDIDEKLKRIESYLVERSQVAEIVQSNTGSTESSDSHPVVRDKQTKTVRIKGP